MPRACCCHHDVSDERRNSLTGIYYIPGRAIGGPSGSISIPLGASVASTRYIYEAEGTLYTYDEALLGSRRFAGARIRGKGKSRTVLFRQHIELYKTLDTKLPA